MLGLTVGAMSPLGAWTETHIKIGGPGDGVADLIAQLASKVLILIPLSVGFSGTLPALSLLALNTAPWRSLLRNGLGCPREGPTASQHAGSKERPLPYHPATSLLHW